MHTLLLRPIGIPSPPIHHRRAVVASVLLICCCFPVTDVSAQQPIQASGFVVLAEQAQVAARDSGLILELSVKPGDKVQPGMLLGKLDDAEATLAVERAELDLAIAELALRTKTALNIANSKLAEGKIAFERARLSQQIAEQLAENDISVRHATKSRDAARANLLRAQKSRQAVRTSVSKAEIDRLTLIVEQHELEIEKSKFDLAVNKMRQQLESANVSEARQAVQRLGLDVEQAETDFESLRINKQRFANAKKLAQLKLSRRHIKSPIHGVVAELQQRPGQWVETGAPVLRIVRLDKLHAEGYVSVTHAMQSLEGRSAAIEFLSDNGPTKTARGKVIFVADTIDRVNKQSLIRVEFDNKAGSFKPGMSIRMLVSPSKN